MPGRTLLAAFALSAVALTAACSSSSTPADSSPTSSAPAQVKTQASTALTPSATPTGTEPKLTPPAPTVSSPALAKYDHATVAAVLDLATHLAYYSVADPTLLGKAAAHTSIADYNNITRYLTPQGIAYLTSYVQDQDRNGKNAAVAGQLALASVHIPPGIGKEAKSTNGTRFNVPFAPRNYRAVINPNVRLGNDGISMLVTGRCSVRIPGTQNGKKVVVTLTRKSFTYYLQPSPSKAYPVGVSGWVSSSTASYAAG